MSQGLIQEIIQAAKQPDDTVVRPFTFRKNKQNELLLFVKPEGFSGKSEETQTAVLNLILQKLSEFKADISGIELVTGSTLAKHEIMDRHYGYINLLSRKGSTEIANADREVMAKELGVTAPVLGGHEVLAQFSSLSASALDALWATKKSLRVRSGMYYQSYTIEGTELTIINGFHPAQLEQYTAPTKRLAVCLLHSDTHLGSLRNDLIGDTFPERAVEGSIRGDLWRGRERFGTPDIGIAANYVHLSAGPFEAGTEIRNFLGSLQGDAFSIESTNLALKGLTAADLALAFSNPLCKNSRSLFSETENQNTDDAILRFREEFLG